MAFLISPGVQVNEIDLTNVIPALAASTAGYAGHFTWGPVGQLVTVSSEKDLITNFGSPDASTAKSFFTAASFLKYGNNLKVSRAVATDAKNSTGAVAGQTVSNGDKRLIRNLDEYESIATPLTTAAITARYPGASGDSVRVIITRPTDTAWNATDAISTTIRQNFSSKPGSTSFADAYAENIGQAAGSILDEIHVLVIDNSGAISGTPGSILERYEGLSLARDAKTETGATNYYKNVINRSSNYIYITSLSSVNVAEWEQADKPIAQVFAAGSTVTVPVLTLNGVQSVVNSPFAYNSVYDITTGTAQVETQTIVAASGATTAGNLNVTVTSALVTGSPLVIPVALTTADNTAALVATKVRAALNATAAITTHYTVGGTGAIYSLTVIKKPTNSGITDTTFNIAHANGTSVGITASTTSVRTPGVVMNLVARLVEDLIASDGNTYDVSVTVKKTSDGTAIVAPVTTETAATVTVTTVKTIGTVVQTPVSETFGIIIDENVGIDIAITAYNLNIAINSTSNIIIGYPVYQTITAGGGYPVPTAAGVQNIQCAGAVVGSVTTPGSITTALQYLADAETVDVNFIFGETYNQGSETYVGSPQATIDSAIATIVNARKDCVGFISAPLDMSTQFSDATKKTYLLNKATNIIGSSYLIMDSTPVYVYNKYSDSYVWISACGHMAGLCANADRVADAWFSPAGLNRGGLLGVTKLAYNADQTSRDDIYKLGVNPIVSFPGQGIILYGDKTLQRKPSAFDRINVRRLFITLEKAIATSAKFQLFEQNDDFTRSSFRNAIEPFLRDVQGRRGITDFRVVCDATNNTGEIIDGNRFVADIYIKPTRSINYITLNFIATRTGVEFKEIVG
jgi:phage tail sheath protein FI